MVPSSKSRSSSSKLRKIKEGPRKCGLSRLSTFNFLGRLALLKERGKPRRDGSDLSRRVLRQGSHPGLSGRAAKVPQESNGQLLKSCEVARSFWEGHKALAAVRLAVKL